MTRALARLLFLNKYINKMNQMNGKPKQRSTIRIETIKGMRKRRELNEIELIESQPQRDYQDLEQPEPSLFSKGSSRILKGPADLMPANPEPQMTRSARATSRLNKVWRNQPLNVIYYISKFTRQLKTNANRIKFKLLNLRILSLINDQSSDSATLLEQRDNTFRNNHRLPFKFGESVRNLLRHIPVIEPDARWKILWDMAVLLAIVVNIFYIPMELCFEFDSNSDVTFILNTLPSYLFVLDIFLTFNTAYYWKGQIHRDQLEIIKHYAKGKLLMDTIIVVPLLLAGFNLPWLKFSLLFRVFRVPQMLEGIEEVLSPNQNVATLLSLLKLVYFIIIMCHFCACVWVFLGEVQISSGSNSWLTYYGFQASDWTTKYIVALYFSTITTLTIGYGDIVPQTTVERLYVIILALLVCGVLGYSVSTVGQIVKSLQDSSHANKQKLLVITRYLKSRNLSQQLQLQVRKYFEHSLKFQSEAQKEAELMMEGLPKELQAKVAIDMYADMLTRTRLFESLCEGCVRKLCMRVHEAKVAPEQIIWSAGDCAHRLVFVVKGQVESFCDKTSLKQYKKGAIGEREFAIQGTFMNSLRAKHFAQVAYLSYEDFIKVIQNHQEDCERFLMLRDNLLFNENFRTFGQICEVCEWTHQMSQCPFVFLKLSKVKVVGSYKRELKKEQERSAFARLEGKHKTKQGLTRVVDQALNFMVSKELLTDSDFNKEYLERLGVQVEEASSSDGTILSSDDHIETKNIVLLSNAEDSQNDQECKSPPKQTLQKQLSYKSQKSKVRFPMGIQKGLFKDATPVKQKENGSPQLSSIQEVSSWRHLDTISLSHQNSLKASQKMSPKQSTRMLDDYQKQSSLETVQKQSQSKSKKTQKDLRLNSTEASVAQESARIDFDLDKLKLMRLYFPTYNFDEVIHRFNTRKDRRTNRPFHSFILP